MLADMLIGGVVNFISGKKLGTIDIPDQKEVIPGPNIIKNRYLKSEGGTLR